MLIIMTLASLLLVTGELLPATETSTLTTDKGQIRQFAFDGKRETWFASAQKPGDNDSFTLQWSRPVALKKLEVWSGRPDGSGRIKNAVVEASADGLVFRSVCDFEDGRARAVCSGEPTRAIRIRATGPATEPWAIAEIGIETDPAIVRFRYPVEFVIDVADAPELKDWAERAVLACTQAYPMINDELRSDGYVPATVIEMSLKSDYKGVAEASGNRIKGSVAFFKAHPDDIGAMIHETVHVVQRYRGRRNPSWLVEGVADYIRFFKYEPGKIGPIRGRAVRYNASYRVSAAFLAYVVDKYDKDFILKLNKAMREGKYTESLFKEATGKELKQLGEEWEATRRPKEAGEPPKQSQKAEKASGPR